MEYIFMCFKGRSYSPIVNLSKEIIKSYFKMEYITKVIYEYEKTEEEIKSILLREKEIFYNSIGECDINEKKRYLEKKFYANVDEDFQKNKYEFPHDNIIIPLCVDLPKCHGKFKYSVIALEKILLTNLAINYLYFRFAEKIPSAFGRNENDETIVLQRVEINNKYEDYVKKDRFRPMESTSAWNSCYCPSNSPISGEGIGKPVLLKYTVPYYKCVMSWFLTVGKGFLDLQEIVAILFNCENKLLDFEKRDGDSLKVLEQAFDDNKKEEESLSHS